jgi:predicted transcriptional regulator
LTDRNLVVEAIRRAGSQKALAEVFGVSQSAISEWGRARPIPRHVRARLESYIGLQHPDRRSTDEGHQGIAPAMKEILRPLESELVSGQLVHLPPQYERRYEERVRELISWVRRELSEYRKVLDAEHRSKRNKRKKGGKQPE